jgi:hypothetical protein
VASSRRSTPTSDTTKSGPTSRLRCRPSRLRRSFTRTNRQMRRRALPRWLAFTRAYIFEFISRIKGHDRQPGEMALFLALSRTLVLYPVDVLPSLHLQQIVTTRGRGRSRGGS